MMPKSQSKTLAIGLTGGIGSGKTEVGKIFEKFGAKLIKADTTARVLIDSQNDIRVRIEKLFGKDIYLTDGKLDRKKVAALIFSDKKLQMELNNIVHPQVINFINVEIRRLKKSKKYPLIIVEAALIFEAGNESSYDYIIVVNADEEIRIKRLMERDYSSHDEIVSRFKSQLSQDEKIEKADFVITNDGDLKSLEEKCLFVFDILKQLSTLPVESEEV